MLEVIQNLNTALFLQIFSLSQTYPFLNLTLILITDYLVFIMFFIIALFGLFGGLRDRKTLVLTILSIPLAYLIINILNILVFEPRPFITLPIEALVPDPTTPSFPSRHATWSAVATFAPLFYKTRYFIFHLIFMILVGFSRIFVGVHYPLDVLSGFLVGLLAVSLAWQIKKLISRNLT